MFEPRSHGKLIGFESPLGQSSHGQVIDSDTCCRRPSRASLTVACRAVARSVWQDFHGLPAAIIWHSLQRDRGSDDGHLSPTKTSGHTFMIPSEPHDGPTNSRSPTRRRSASVRQEQLIEIAIRFFAKKGYEGTSLRDIAEEARITKAALYYHFPNKEALYERIVVSSMQALLDDVSKAVNAAPDAEAKVRRFMLASADFLDRSRDSWIASSNAFWSGSQAAPRLSAVNLRDAYEGLLRNCIHDAITEGTFRKVDPAMAGRMLLSMLNNISRWHSASGAVTTYQVIEQYLDFAFHGFCVQRVNS